MHLFFFVNFKVHCELNILKKSNFFIICSITYMHVHAYAFNTFCMLNMLHAEHVAHLT